jgi:hypothetical protein
VPSAIASNRLSRRAAARPIPQAVRATYSGVTTAIMRDAEVVARAITESPFLKRASVDDSTVPLASMPRRTETSDDLPHR